MRNIVCFLTALTAVLLSSCESFLDVKSNATYVIPNSVEDAQALLDDVFRMNESVVPTWGESVIDDYYLSEDAIGFFAGSDELQFYKWEYPEYFGNFNDWGFAYSAIYNANLAMEIVNQVNRTPINSKEWDNVMGSALFFRGFYTYCLLTNFALAYDEQTAMTDLGVPLRLNSNFNEISKRASVQECMNQIVDDLIKSMDYLPDYPLILTRPSKGASYAALAKVYLYMRDYAKALQYSEKALELNSQLMDYKGDSDIVDQYPDNTPFVQFHKETIFYAEMIGGLWYPSVLGTIDSFLYRSYSPDDLRKTLFFYSNNGLPSFRGFYTGDGIKQSCFGGLSTNELYLIKAESLAFLNRTDEALQTMNQLLENRIRNYKSPEDINTKDSLLKFIRDERRKELVYRNTRFTDVKRYNMEGSNIILRRVVDGIEYVLEPNSPKYALPLPNDLIRLTGMPQN